MSVRPVDRDGQSFLGLAEQERRNETLTILLNWLTPEHLGQR
jgi:hypothetical protein